MTEQGPPPIPAPPTDRALPVDTKIQLDTRTKIWAGGKVLIGGSPWRLSRLAPAAQAIVGALANRVPRPAENSQDLVVYRELVDRGFARAVSTGHSSSADCVVVIPAMNRTDTLERCLKSVATQQVLVIDDGSLNVDEMSAVARNNQAAFIAHPENRGPASARNTGIRETDSAFIAFLDSDCVAPEGWPQSMLHHFDDPAVAAVAPRIVPRETSTGLIQRYERTRSSLDMGIHPELVRPGSRLGFLPSAALIVRRAALQESGFDDALRLGEDVDLIWRLVEAGWHVKYDPSVLVRHEIRAAPREWIRRRYEYGTSAAALERRHPGNLTPARLSGWNVAALSLFATRKSVLALGVTAAAVVGLRQQTQSIERGNVLAGRIVIQGLLADSAAVGHLLRREWWPLGAAALVFAPRSRIARVAAATMLTPIALEYVSRWRSLDPVRYAALRLVDDSSYGTGVIVNSVRERSWAPLLPTVRLPRWRGR